MESRHQLILMNPSRVKRTIRRMAFQLAEDISNPSIVVIAGLNVRGYVIGSMLKEQLETALGEKIDLFRIDANSSEQPGANFSVDGRDVILVDDVLFSGRTMMRAMNAISDNPAPDRIRIAVLIDRGHRKFPLYPEVLGLRYPTKFDEHVKIETDEASGTISVILYEG